MDKRKLKFRSGLHKNLVGSQSSQISSRLGSSQAKSLNEDTSSKSTLSSGKTFSNQSQHKSSTEESFTKSNKSFREQILSRKNVSKEETVIRGNNVTKEATSSLKRKSNFNLSDNESDLGSPLAESTVLKKKRNDLNITQEKSKNTTCESILSHPAIISQKNVNSISPQKSKFVEFLHESGIKLKNVAPHVLCNDIIIVQRKMQDLLKLGKYNKLEVINLMEKYFESEANFENALTDMEIIITDEISNVLHSPSLVKVLLQIPELHPEIYSSLMTKLNETVLIADSVEAVPWVFSLLQQFRFLDVVTNSDVLTNSLEQLLESCPTWFQRELILFLPDIVTDKQHQTIAEILNKVMEENSELTNVILDCMSNLNLGKGYLDEYKEKILNMLKTNVKVNAIPHIVKFVLEDCEDTEIFKKTLTVLRNCNIQPLIGEKPEECYKNQLTIANTLKINMLLSKNIINVAMAFIKDITKDPKPLDIIILLLTYSTADIKKKNVETVFKHHIRSGFYRTSLLSSLYTDYKQVLQELQSAALQLSSNLLKADERVFIDFAIDWIRLQFICHKGNVFKQRELLEKIIFLMGDSDQTVKNALAFLCTMVTKEEERQCLVPHCNHLRILLEKMDNLGLEEVGTLNDLLYNLCTSSNSVSESLRDDLFILLQKQLSNFKPLTKCKGVLAAVMAIKNLMKTAESSSTAYNLFSMHQAVYNETVLKSVKNCPRSQALFYDQLARIIIETENIHTEFIKNLTNYIEEEFVNTYMIDRTSYKGDLVPMFGLNKEEDEPQNCVLTFENKKYGAIVPITFKLLRICSMRLSDKGDLEAIDSLLGCAILMPENFDIAENSVVDSIMCCINWFREVISAFVTQNDPLLQKQILQRLNDLIYLQSELNTLFSLCDIKYQPPPCYFHHFPIPSFVRIEKKSGKKGKKKKKGSTEKSINFSGTESWELDSLLYSKNPMYFRRLDATTIHLLDLKMQSHNSQSTAHGISIKQVCFIIKELLSIFENERNEEFIRDLIKLLPKICSKLQDILSTLRELNDNQNKEAVKLLLSLLTKAFNWKGFESVTYNIMLREGLRILASQIDENNVMLRSCKELVAESCKYFESMADIATQISLAIALINMCQSLMKHSESYTKQNKEKYAKLAFGFLCLQWPEDKDYTSQYKTAVVGLLNSWIDNEPLPLDTVSTVLEWLPDEISKLEKSRDYLSKIPSITRNNFHLLLKKMFDGLINGVKLALLIADSDPKRIELWYQVALNVQKLVQICKSLTTRNNILIFLKYMPILLKIFLSLGIPVLEYNLKYQPEDVTKILKMLQGGTRYLHTICCDSAQKKDVTLTKHVPAAKTVLERLLYSVKGMLVLNNSPAAFWMGNLINKNLEGHEILSQTVSSEGNSLPNSDLTDDLDNDISSDILESDSNDNVEDDTT